MDYPIGKNVLEGGRECRCHNGGGEQKRSYEGHIHCVTLQKRMGLRARTQREGLAGGIFSGDYLGCTHVSMIRGYGPQKKASAKVESIH